MSSRTCCFEKGRLFGVGFREFEGAVFIECFESEGAAFDVDVHESDLIALPVVGIFLAFAPAFAFGSCAADDELCAAFGLEDLAVVVMSAEVEVEFSADLGFHEFLDQASADVGERDGKCLVFSRVSVFSVGDVRVMSKGKSPRGGCIALEAVTDKLGLIGFSDIKEKFRGIEADKERMLFCESEVLLGEDKERVFLSVADIMIRFPDFESCTECAVVVVALCDVPRKTERVVHVGKFGFELWVVFVLDTDIIEVVAEKDTKVTSSPFGLFGLAFLLDGDSNVLLGAGSCSSVAHRDKAKGWFGCGFGLWFGLRLRLCGFGLRLRLCGFGLWLREGGSGCAGSGVASGRTGSGDGSAGRGSVRTCEDPSGVGSLFVPVPLGSQERPHKSTAKRGIKSRAFIKKLL